MKHKLSLLYDSVLYYT